MIDTQRWSDGARGGEGYKVYTHKTDNTKQDHIMAITIPPGKAWLAADYSVPIRNDMKLKGGRERGRGDGNVRGERAGSGGYRLTVDGPNPHMRG
jgi:hypothetical protein